MEFGAFLKRFVGAALPALVVAGAGFSATGANAQNLEVYLSPPAVQNTVVSGALIETFERGPGSIGASGTWNIGNYTASTGSYDAAGVYGGAGRTGYYLGVHTGPINVAVAPGYQYVGFWWSAGDASNIITFYDEHGVQLIRFTTADINALLSGTGTVPTVGGGTYPKASFFGNPNPPGGNTGEPYAYVNLILTNTTSTFGSIKIEGSNFELDNLSIAYPTSPQSNWVPVTTYPMALAAVNDAYATPAGQTVSGNVSTNDATPSVGVTPTYAVVTNVSHGTLTLNSSTGAFSYTPNAGFTGVDTFTYNRCRTDAPTVCSLATVTITVFDAVNDTNSTLAGQTVTGNAASNDAFPVGSTFSGPTSSTNGGRRTARPSSHAASTAKRDVHVVGEVIDGERVGIVAAVQVQAIDAGVVHRARPAREGVEVEVVGVRAGRVGGVEDRERFDAVARRQRRVAADVGIEIACGKADHVVAIVRVEIERSVEAGSIDVAPTRRWSRSAAHGIR